MSKSEEFSISEFQRLSEYVSSSDESPETGSNSPQVVVNDPVPSEPFEEPSSDEEVELDLNNLSSLVKECDDKPKSKDEKDIDSLFSTTKLNLKKENDLNIAKKRRDAHLRKHLSSLNPKTEDEPVKDVTFKEWHVPLMEVPNREHEPRSKKKKKLD